jgi:quercetin dioxygenase-like cupin family protein
LTRLSYQIISLDALQSASCELAPLESELCFVKSGRLEVTINGVSWRAGEGSFFYCEPNQKLALKNIGSTPAVYQLIRIVPAPVMAN